MAELSQSSLSSHKAPSNIQMVNERSDILVKEACPSLHKSSREYIARGGEFTPTEKRVCSLPEND